MQLYRDFRIGIALRAQLHNAASAVVFLLQQFTDPLPLQACVGMLGQGILDQVVFQQVICADVGAALTQTSSQMLRAMPNSHVLTAQSPR